ncbi:hypothetical protein NUSPORA_00237 [Nucleospora cyclopteri]
MMPLFYGFLYQSIYNILVPKRVTFSVEQANPQPVNPQKFLYSKNNKHDEKCFFYNLDLTTVEFFTTHKSNFVNEDTFYYTSRNVIKNKTACLRCKCRMNIYFAIHRLINIPNTIQVCFPVPQKIDAKHIFFPTFYFQEDTGQIHALYAHNCVFIIFNNAVCYTLYPSIKSKIGEQKIALSVLFNAAFNITEIKPLINVEFRKILINQFYLKHEKTKYCLVSDFVEQQNQREPLLIEYPNKFNTIQELETLIRPNKLKTIEDISQWEHPDFKFYTERFIDPALSITSIPKSVPTGKGADKKLFENYESNVDDIVKYHAQRMAKATILKTFNATKSIIFSFLFTVIIIIALFVLNTKGKII